ncbi:hypothetical protein [Streptomyces sp. NPDC054804]
MAGFNERHQGKLRPWSALVGPLLAVVVLTAAPAGVKAGELSWPKWLVAGLVAAGGVLVAVWTPLVKARTDALAARTTRAAERDAQAEEALSRLPALKGKVLLVKDVTDRALLGIHEAIPLSTDSALEQRLSAELPTYVLRDIDADLRTALEARSKTGGFVLLVGPAAAGKTRCAYEAIQAVLPHWRFFMPPDAATITELVTGGADLEHSVVWLNETQNFLTGPDPLKAATVRRMLADTARPVMLIGTIWPSIYDQLRTPATSTDQENQTGQDLNKEAREVLELARRFSLGKWSDQEWERAEELASMDPRIGQVLRHRGRTGLAQMLSAGPELIHRGRQPFRPGRHHRCSRCSTLPSPCGRTGPCHRSPGQGIAHWHPACNRWRGVATRGIDVGLPARTPQCRHRTTPTSRRSHRTDRRLSGFRHSRPPRGPDDACI